MCDALCSRAENCERDPAATQRLGPGHRQAAKGSVGAVPQAAAERGGGRHKLIKGCMRPARRYLMLPAFCFVLCCLHFVLCMPAVCMPAVYIKKQPPSHCMLRSRWHENRQRAQFPCLHLRLVLEVLECCCWRSRRGAAVTCNSAGGVRCGVAQFYVG